MPTIATAALVITEVQPQTTAGTASTINGDWWELTNSGSSAVNLDGYMWADTEDDIFGGTPQPNVFPSVSIGPGESIIILEEAAVNEAAWRTNWSVSSSLQILATDEMLPFGSGTDTFSGLGSANDAVYFYSPSFELVSSYSWIQNTRGTTFDQDAAGVNLGLSVVGENGAYAAIPGNGDIGSPGFAVTGVPEPNSLVILFLGIALAASGKRIR